MCSSSPPPRPAPPPPPPKPKPLITGDQKKKKRINQKQVGRRQLRIDLNPVANGQSGVNV